MSVALNGCCPEPLGSYLKALAVLRLVSEQEDPQARGWWDERCFHLESRLDQAGLVDFFLARYRPTAIVAPWNGGSGFYPKDRTVGIDAIAGSGDARFAEYRETIEIARSIEEVAHAKGGSKTDEDDRRLAILLACRNRLPDAAVNWLDAAVGVSAEGKRAFAPIFGTGGNEGRLDYTNNFMENLANLLIEPAAKTPVRDLLSNALFGSETGGYDDGSVGQYDPGRAGGANQGPAVSNPWNFVLTMEGAVSWAAGLYRRQGVSFRSFLCSPFTVRASAVGYGSATEKDGQSARAEIWTPLWERPACYAELKSLLREGRASVEGKPAGTGLEFAQAVSMLRVDRGISSFVRYHLLKRRGDSYIALPAGRFRADRYRENSALFREAPAALAPADQAFRDSAAYRELRRMVDASIFDSLLHDNGMEGLRDAGAAIGRLNRWALSVKETGRPAARLSWAWIERLQQCGAEARIAAALAGIYDRENLSIRVNLDRASNQFAWLGDGLTGRLDSVLERRVLTAAKLEAKLNPVASSCEAQLEDVERFLDFDVDDRLIEDLLFCFLLAQPGPPEKARHQDGAAPWPVYVLMKHLFLAQTLEADGERIRLRPDLTALSLLRANKVREAAEIAVRRLTAAGLAPIRAAYEGGIDGPRLAASLLIPVAFGPKQFRMVRMTHDEKERKNA